MSNTAKILIFSLIVALSFCRNVGFPETSKITQDLISQVSNKQGVQVQYFNQKVSHYNYKMTGKTYKQKYLIDSSNWNREAHGPIIMYCGNEGPIQMFYKNAGFYNDVVAKELNAMLLYPQHRYFGVSMPFGTQNASYTKQNLVYLTTQEALMDFVQFIKHMKTTLCPECKVIVFGGSYGGMLATWIRMKYPHVIDIAHAASAPIYYYRNRKNFNTQVFFEIVSKNYRMHSQNCENTIREAFRRLSIWSQTPSAPTSVISQYFNLCKPLKTYQDIEILMQYINDAYSYMAMLNYPYPTSFLKNLTAWPANSSCIPLDTVTPSSSDKQLFTAIRKSVEYYYSFEEHKCNEIYEDQTADEDMSGWNILACGDQAMPMDMDGTNDMFYPEKFDYQAYSSWCKQTYGISPDYDYTLNHFGGVTDEQYLGASKIIFTNGGLDPWSGASPTKTLSDTLISCFMEHGAHHLDLRSPNQADPKQVIECRQLIISTFKKWLGMKQQQKNDKMIRSE